MKNKKLKVTIIEHDGGISFKAEGSKLDAVYYMFEAILSILGNNKGALTAACNAFIEAHDLKDAEKK